MIYLLHYRSPLELVVKVKVSYKYLLYSNLLIKDFLYSREYTLPIFNTLIKVVKVINI